VLSEYAVLEHAYRRSGRAVVADERPAPAEEPVAGWGLL
jgi:hypothetical protein